MEAAVSPAAQPEKSRYPPPLIASSSIPSIMRRAPVGPCGCPKMREEPKLFMPSASSPIAFAMTRSLAAKGLCVLIAPRSAALIPALSRAICAEGATAAAMNAFFVRANPKETIRTSSFGSTLSSFAFSRVVTRTPQFPSAGYVWVP